jgi:hypothetical protein
VRYSKLGIFKAMLTFLILKLHGVKYVDDSILANILVGKITLLKVNTCRKVNSRDKNSFIQPMNWTVTLDEFTLAKVSERLVIVEEPNSRYIRQKPKQLSSIVLSNSFDIFLLLLISETVAFLVAVFASKSCWRIKISPLVIIVKGMPKFVAIFLTNQQRMLLEGNIHCNNNKINKKLILLFLYPLKCR